MVMTGVVALIVEYGSGLQEITANRLYPELLPEPPVLPAMTYRIASGRSFPGLDTSGPQKLRVQFDCYGETYKAAKDLREALRQLLNGFSGRLPNGSLVGSILWVGPLDGFAQYPRQFRCGCEFYLLFSE